MYFKYKGVNEFKNFVDILVNKRLYAASYKELNDPMEGYYEFTSGERNDEVIRRLRDKKDAVRICSLTRNPDNPLMWSHYSEGGRGVVIGLSVNEDSCDIRKIDYEGPIILNRANLAGWDAEGILSRKLRVWEYEDEWRIFVRNSKYVSVKIESLILGPKMDSRTKSLVRRLMDLIGLETHVSEADRRIGLELA